MKQPAAKNAEGGAFFQQTGSRRPGISPKASWRRRRTSATSSRPALSLGLKAGDLEPSCPEPQSKGHFAVDLVRHLNAETPGKSREGGAWK